MFSPLDVSSDLSERLNYNIPDFPLYIKRDNLSRYGYKALCHWHTDLEFIFALHGSMNFFVNGAIYHLEGSSGIFVNSKRLHYGFSEDHTDCEFIALVISPSLFFEHALATKKYFKEKFGSSSQDCICLNKQVEWQRNILDTMYFLNKEMSRNQPNILRIMSLSTLLCADVGDHLVTGKSHLDEDSIQNLVWRMTDYIHRNYDRRISLNDIAGAGMICRSKCCQLFKTYLKQSPNNYLTRYRLAKSRNLLRNTHLTVSEISAICGFQTPSYFTHVFNKEMGKTPKEFRQSQ